MLPVDAPAYQEGAQVYFDGKPHLVKEVLPDGRLLLQPVKGDFKPYGARQARANIEVQQDDEKLLTSRVAPPPGTRAVPDAPRTPPRELPVGVTKVEVNGVSQYWLNDGQESRQISKSQYDQYLKAQPTRFAERAAAARVEAKATPGARPTNVTLDFTTEKGVTFGKGTYADRNNIPIEIVVSKTAADTWELTLNRGNQSTTAIISTPTGPNKLTKTQVRKEIKRLIDDGNFSDYVEGGTPPQLAGATETGPARWVTTEAPLSQLAPPPRRIFTSAPEADPPEIATLRREIGPRVDEAGRPMGTPKPQKVFNIEPLETTSFLPKAPESMDEAKSILAGLTKKKSEAEQTIKRLQADLEKLPARKSSNAEDTARRKSLENGIEANQKTINLIPEWERILTKRTTSTSKFYQHFDDISLQNKISEKQYNEILSKNAARQRTLAEHDAKPKKTVYFIDGKEVNKNQWTTAKAKDDAAIRAERDKPFIGETPPATTPVSSANKELAERATTVSVVTSAPAPAPKATTARYVPKRITRGSQKNSFKLWDTEKQVYIGRASKEEASIKSEAAKRNAETGEPVVISKESTFDEVKEILDNGGEVDTTPAQKPQFTVETDGKKFWVLQPNGRKTSGRQPTTKLEAETLAARKNDEIARATGSPAATGDVSADIPASAVDETTDATSARLAEDAGLTPEELQKKYGSVYMGGFTSFPESLRPYMKAAVEKIIEDDAEAIKRATRGVVTDTEKEALGRKIAAQRGIPDWSPGKVLNVEEMWLTAEVYGSSVRDLTTKADEINLWRQTHGKDEPVPGELLLELQNRQIRSAELYFQMQGSASEAGRALRAMRAIYESSMEFGADGKLKPDVFGKLIKKLGIEREQLESFAHAFSKIDATKPEQLSSFIRSFNTPKKFEYVYEIYVNSILSSPMTHLRNAMGNSLAILLSATESVTAAGLERGVRGLAKVNLAPKAWKDRPVQRFFNEEMTVFADWQGIKEGSKHFLDVLKHGISPEKASKLEFYPRAWKGRLGTFFNTPAKLLEASDAFFYSINSRIQTNKLAIREAHKAVDADGNLLEGQALLDKIIFIKENPTEEMLEQVHKATEYRLFRQEPGQIGKDIMKFRTKNPVTKLVVPFFRTPTNLFKFGVERTPLGLLQGKKGLLSGLSPSENTFLNAIKAGDAEALDIAAKSLIGTTAMIGVYTHFKDGNITGAVPINPADRERFWREEKRPYSIKIGGKWWEYRRLEPFNQIFTVVASIDEAKDSDEEIEGKLAQVALDIGQGAISQTWLQGVSDMVSMIDSDDTTPYEQTLTRMALNFLPYSSLTRLGTQQLDTRMMKETDDTFSGRFKDLGQQQLGLFSPLLPFLSSKDQLPRRDAFGREVYRHNILSPISVSTSDITAIDAELAKLPEFEIGTVTNNFEGIELPQDWYDYKKLIYGQAIYTYLTLAIDSPQYQGFDNDYDKQKHLQRSMSDAKDLANSILKTHIEAGADRADIERFDFDKGRQAQVKRGRLDPQNLPPVPYKYGEQQIVQGDIGSYEEKLLDNPQLQAEMSRLSRSGKATPDNAPIVPTVEGQNGMSRSTEVLF